MQKQKLLNLVLAGVGLLAMTGVASAAALTLSALNPGILNGGNYSVQVDAGVGACINFYNTSPGTCNPGPAAATDTFTVNAPSDAIFGTVGVTTGLTHDFLAANQGGLTPPTAPYAGGTGFLTINGITFDFTSIGVPNVLACPPSSAPGVCSFGDFIFTQLDFNTPAAQCPGGVAPCGQVNVSFSAFGIGYTGTSADGSTPYSFVWSSQFTKETTDDLIAKAQRGGVQDAVSFSASPGAPAPEPVSMVLIGGGLIALATIRRRRRA
jgi:hypothetical protein